METKKEVVFTDGLFIKRPPETAPAFVKAKCSAKVDVFVAWLQKHKNAEGYVNFDILKSSKEAGNLYGQLDNWEKPSVLTTQEKEQIIAIKKANNEKVVEIDPNDIPF